jgi:hypothetical protein
MTTMSWSNNDGTKGRCDAKCHNATGPKCHCMCGGRYHATKTNGTFDDVQREHGREIIENAKRLAESQGYELHFPQPQPTLLPT